MPTLDIYDLSPGYLRSLSTDQLQEWWTLRTAMLKRRQELDDRRNGSFDLTLQREHEKDHQEFIDEMSLGGRRWGEEE